MKPAPGSFPTGRGGQFLALYWPDLRNLWIIAFGMFAVLLVLPLAHEYPVIDDWIYARSVQYQASAGQFAMPERSQANLLGLTLWGTLWTRLFGFRFTALTASTLVLAFVCVVAFYLLA